MKSKSSFGKTAGLQRILYVCLFLNILNCVRPAGSQHTEIPNHLHIGLEDIDIAEVLATETLRVSQRLRCAGHRTLPCGGARLQGLEGIILHCPTRHVIRC